MADARRRSVSIRVTFLTHPFTQSGLTTLPELATTILMVKLSTYCGPTSMSSSRRRMSPTPPPADHL